MLDARAMPDAEMHPADHRPDIAVAAELAAEAASNPADSLFTRARLAIVILVVLAMLAVISAIQFQAPHTIGMQKVLTDYDAFHIAGLLALDGRAEDAYRFETMLAAQREFTGTVSMMPWTYPPPFTLFVAGMANLPIGVGFLLFISATLMLYLTVLRRIAGIYWPGVLIVMLPTLPLLMRTGQNGFLTGGLIGLFLLAFFRRKPGAGLPLGLMVIKPHLAVAIALITLVERRWQTIAIAAATVAVLLLVPTWVFGLGIWSAFLEGVAQSSGFLAEGQYKLFRMTSLYATAHTLGAGSGPAMAIQVAGAILAIAVVLLARRRQVAPHRLAAAICCATVFISPYNYDYDLTIFGLAVAFVLPDMLQRTSAIEQAGMVALVWIGTGYGLFHAVTIESEGSSLTSAASGLEQLPVALMGPILLVVIALATRVLSRAPRAGTRSDRRDSIPGPAASPAVPAA